MFQLASADHVALVVHVYLLAGDVLATIAVGIGILWESEALITSHEMARKLVLWGVVLETLCSVALFTFDEGISGAQQSIIESQQEKIIALETEIAPRTLTSDQQAKMSEALRPFAGLVVHLVVYPLDVDGSRFAKRLQAVLKTSGISTPYGPHICGRPNNTVVVDLVTGVYIAAGDRPPQADQFGNLFATLLTSAGIEAQRGHLVHCEMPFGEVEVVVGIKPIAGDPSWNDGR